VKRSDIKAAEKIESIADTRDLAARRLPRGIFQRYEAGSSSNATRDKNTQVGHRDALAA
jgi:hypothetical protein